MTTSQFLTLTDEQSSCSMYLSCVVCTSSTTSTAKPPRQDFNDILDKLLPYLLHNHLVGRNAAISHGTGICLSADDSIGMVTGVKGSKTTIPRRMQRQQRSRRRQRSHRNQRKGQALTKKPKDSKLFSPIFYV